MKPQIKRASSLKALGRVEEALEGYLRVLALDPNNSEASKDIGICHLVLDKKSKGKTEFEAENYHEAVKYYSEALQHNAYDPRVLSNRAACYHKLEQWHDCIEVFQKCSFLKSFLIRIVT